MKKRHEKRWGQKEKADRLVSAAMLLYREKELKTLAARKENVRRFQMSYSIKRTFQGEQQCRRGKVITGWSEMKRIIPKGNAGHRKLTCNDISGKARRNLHSYITMDNGQ